VTILILVIRRGTVHRESNRPGCAARCAGNLFNVEFALAIYALARGAPRRSIMDACSARPVAQIGRVFERKCHPPDPETADCAATHPASTWPPDERNTAWPWVFQHGKSAACSRIPCRWPRGAVSAVLTASRTVGVIGCAPRLKEELPGEEACSPHRQQRCTGHRARASGRSPRTGHYAARRSERLYSTPAQFDLARASHPRIAASWGPPSSLLDSQNGANPVERQELRRTFQSAAPASEPPGEKPARHVRVSKRAGFAAQGEWCDLGDLIAWLSSARQPPG
jgi:hypothetical protein